jgi:hypothetical protein
MRTSIFAATSFILFTAFCIAQQPTPSDSQPSLSTTTSARLNPVARSAPAAPAEPSPSVRAALFNPVDLPPDPACNAPTPAASAPTLNPPAAAFARLPNAPEVRSDSRKRFFFSNAAMYGATVFHAFGRAYEVEACKRESGFINGVYATGSYQGQAPATQAKFFAIALPIDAGVTALSLLARHKGWHALEVIAPLSATSAHITAGAFKFSSGCY